ncbi:hypothetical protein GCM10009555_017370 [Acrocarpospora macrocephala]|uniref:Tail assembly chaperone n=1 Tax=Acrocarpospora macrocephala TaxID=150177 RepID=A0A5M3WEA7_9ACTN|nr:hypothetical protein [Acrocarpospora macrocephala]GES07397.1 hypothetical protein Amac_009920 [Acrocarpospora macrocephala]
MTDINDDYNDDLDDEPEDAPETFETWDGFWTEVRAEEDSERTGPDTVVIRGVRVEVPRRLPLKFLLKAESVAKASTVDALHDTVGALFGKEALNAWVEDGMDAPELQVALTWGVAQGSGKDMTFREAYAAVKEQEGKAEQEEEKAAASPPKRGNSAATGARSSRTSAANTGSRRARSQS